MTSSSTPAVLPDARAHNMVPGGYGHGLSHCEYCKATDREIAFALGPVCPNAPTPPASDAAVPAGYVLVPVEPTEAMLDAYYDAVLSIQPAENAGRQRGKKVWSAMCTASEDKSSLCEDCPPLNYCTDITRCAPCPRRVSSIPDELMIRAGKRAMTETITSDEGKFVTAVWTAMLAAAPKVASDTCPFCTGASEYQGSPEDAFCERHLSLYRKASAA